jgi:chromosome segregation ATPase
VLLDSDRFTEGFEAYKSRTKQQLIDVTVSPLKNRAVQAEAEAEAAREELSALRNSEAVARKEVQILTSTVTSLRAGVTALRHQLASVEDELRAAGALTAAEQERNSELSHHASQLKLQVESIAELRRMYAEEKEKASKYASKVKSLRFELLNVASDADKALGEEKGARQVAEREAEEAKKQLSLAVSKYKEKEERVHEVGVWRVGKCLLPTLVISLVGVLAAAARIAEERGNVSNDGSGAAIDHFCEGPDD